MDADTCRVTAYGKQVKLDGEHLADARDDEAAEAIAVALNYVGLRSDQLPDGARLTLETFLA